MRTSRRGLFGLLAGAVVALPTLARSRPKPLRVDPVTVVRDPEGTPDQIWGSKQYSYGLYTDEVLAQYHPVRS